MPSFGEFAVMRWELAGRRPVDVSLASFREIFGQDRTEEEYESMSEGKWRYIVKVSVWQRFRCDDIRSRAVSYFFADWCLSDGSRAVRRIQRMFGIKTSGTVTKSLLEMLNAPDSQYVLNRIASARKSYGLKESMLNQNNEDTSWKERLHYYSCGWQ